MEGRQYGGRHKGKQQAVVRRGQEECQPTKLAGRRQVPGGGTCKVVGVCKCKVKARQCGKAGKAGKSPR